MNMRLYGKINGTTNHRIVLKSAYENEFYTAHHPATIDGKIIVSYLILDADSFTSKTGYSALMIDCFGKKWGIDYEYSTLTGLPLFKRV